MYVLEALPIGRASFHRRRCRLNAAPKIAGHVLLASAFFFCLQKFVLGESLETSIIWAIAGGGGAGLLAWLQHRRGG
jgi:hypothetical protein